MSSSSFSIPILLGTNRDGRQSEHVAKLMHERMRQHDRIESQLFDVRDFTFPQNDYGQATKDQNPAWRDAIIGADGLVIVAPEYNHGYPGTLKSALDNLLKEYVHKAVGIVGVSAGPWGGTRVIEQLVPVVRELGLVVSFRDLQFPKVQDLFDDQGNLTDEQTPERIDVFLRELLWLAETLRWGRENVESDFRQ